MKDVKIEKNRGISYGGVIYPLVFNLNVMEEIQDKYETIERWGDLTDGKSHELNARALKFGLTCMLNEGVDMWNEENRDKEDFKAREFFTEKQVGRIVSDLGTQEIARKINDTVIDASKSEEKNL